MKLVDANVLLYAVNSDANHHDVSRSWLDRSLSGDATIAFSWIALLAFIRLSTKVGLFPAPLTTDGAFDRVDAWLSAAPAVVEVPTSLDEVDLDAISDDDIASLLDDVTAAEETPAPAAKAARKAGA